MKKKLLFSFLFTLFFLITAFVIYPKILFASKNSQLVISNDQNFQNQTLDFSPNQKIFIKIEEGLQNYNQSQLRLLDNNYNQIAIIDFQKKGNAYVADFNAPSGSGYYSLEATLSSDGNVKKYVKTLKIGEPDNSSVKVNVKVNSNGNTIKIDKTDKQNIKSENISTNSAEKFNHENSDIIYSVEENKGDQKEPNFFNQLVNLVTQSFGNFFGFIFPS
jgi:hypothetical protein